MKPFLHKLLDNIVLVLSAIGLLLSAFVPLVFAQRTEEIWHLAAITAISVGLLHGAIFWLIRTRQRKVRQQTIAEMREMLHDVVKNQLSVISLNTQLSSPHEKYADRIQHSIHLISDALDHISEESLSFWQQKYETLRQSSVNARNDRD